MKSKEIVMLAGAVVMTSKSLQSLVHPTALGLHVITERRKSKLSSVLRANLKRPTPIEKKKWIIIES